MKLPDYTLLECIGSGAFGNVYRARNRATGTDCAIKTIPHEKLTPRTLSYLGREVAILRSLSHENIARLLDVRSTEDYEYLIFELYNGGDLERFLKEKKGRIEERLVRHVVRQLVRAMNVLHEVSIIHRDIKLANVFLHYPSGKGLPTVKLGDFGFARELSVGELVVPPESDLAMSHVGTPMNMAPEILHDQPYSFKADIWSLGMITYELLCGKPCFSGAGKVDKGVYVIPKDISPSKECVDFISGCLVEDATKRITWEQVLVHPFLLDGTRSELRPRAVSSEAGGYVLSTKGGVSQSQSVGKCTAAKQPEKIAGEKPQEHECEVTFEEAEFGFMKVDALSKGGDDL